MANSFPNSTIVAREVLAVLKNNTTFASKANRQYEAEFSGNMSRGYAPGQTINIKKPPRYTYRAGRDAVPQDTVLSTVPLTLSQGGADLWNTSLDRTLNNVDYDESLYAAAIAVANEIDRQGLNLARNASYNVMNPTGASIATQAAALQVLTDANARLDEMGAPVQDGRRMLTLAPRANGQLIQGMAGLFNSSEKISKQFTTGIPVPSLRLTYDVDQNVDTHTNGAATATNINGAGQTGSAITVVAIAGGTLTRGTKITLPGVFAVNPQTRVSTGQLAQFTVTADALVGATTINIAPAIVTSGAFQNVTASPTTGSPYVILGAASTSYAANVLCHKDAFTLAMVPMFTPPSNAGAKVTQMTEDGFTVKVTEYYDGKTDVLNTRFDVLFGWAATYPELSTLIYTT